MITVELGIGEGDRDRMELWFRRAMEANRARLLETQQRGKRLKAARSTEARTAKLRREAQRQRALAQWSDPKARRKIVAGIRRGHARLRRSQ